MARAKKQLHGGKRESGKDDDDDDDDDEIAYFTVR